MNDCIEWGKTRRGGGYGVVIWDGALRLAHRVEYCKHHHIPLSSIDGLHVRHTCDNPPCVNPDHLILGTAADNMRDKVARGRQSRGETHGGSKLTDEVAKQICALYQPQSRTHGIPSLARKFGVSEETIRLVLKAKIWKHISDPRALAPKKKNKLVGAALHKSGKWFSTIRVSGRKIYLGIFKTETDAHEAYMEAAAKYGLQIVNGRRIQKGWKNVPNTTD